MDLTDSIEKHGKTVSSDAINGKTTYVSLLGIKGAKKAANQLLAQSVNRFNALPNALALKELAYSFINLN
jgi:geranylgeranyl pyrophosphate synthase